MSSHKSTSTLSMITFHYLDGASELEPSTPSSEASSSTSLNKPIAIPPGVHATLTQNGLTLSPTGNVTWLPLTPHHPRNWPLHRKVYNTGLIFFLEFFMTLISNTGSPASTYASSDLGSSPGLSLFSFVTVYLLAQALGGLIFPPIAESFGERGVYVFSTLAFGCACAVITAARSVGVIVVGRGVAGLLSSIPSVVAAGSIANMWDARERIWVVHGWILAAVVGMAAGPVLAVGVCEALGWTWVYGIAALVACSSALLCVAMQESRPSKLLSERVELVAQQSGYKHLTTDTEDSLPTLKEFFRKSLWQPIRLCAEPIIVVVSIMAATVVAVVYLFSEVLGEVYITGFGFSERDYSLVFIAIGLGAIFSLLPRFYDVHVAKKRERNNEILEPEDKLFGFYLAAPVLACGLWWFAWTVPPLVNIGSWPSVLALLLIGYGVVEFDSALSGYLTDAYASYAASASAPMSTLRATLSGVFPLFGRKFFVAVGNNYALSILASFATCFCGIAVLFRMYGRRIREKSPFAISNRESALPMRKFT